MFSLPPHIQRLLPFALAAVFAEWDSVPRMFTDIWPMNIWNLRPGSRWTCHNGFALSGELATPSRSHASKRPCHPAALAFFSYPQFFEVDSHTPSGSQLRRSTARIYLQRFPAQSRFAFASKRDLENPSNSIHVRKAASRRLSQIDVPPRLDISPRSSNVRLEDAISLFDCLDSTLFSQRSYS